MVYNVQWLVHLISTYVKVKLHKLYKDLHNGTVMYVSGSYQYFSKYR